MTHILIMSTLIHLHIKSMKLSFLYNYWTHWTTWNPSPTPNFHLHSCKSIGYGRLKLFVLSLDSQFDFVLTTLCVTLGSFYLNSNTACNIPFWPMSQWPHWSVGWYWVHPACHHGHYITSLEHQQHLTQHSPLQDSVHAFGRVILQGSRLKDVIVIGMTHQDPSGQGWRHTGRWLGMPWWWEVQRWARMPGRICGPAGWGGVYEPHGGSPSSLPPRAEWLAPACLPAENKRDKVNGFESLWLSTTNPTCNLTLIRLGYFGGWKGPPFRSRPWIAWSPQKFAQW